MSNLAYETRDIAQYTDSLARYLPNDSLFAGKNNSSNNIRKFLTGLSYTLFDTNGKIKEFTDNYMPDVTENFLSEWERAVGIPDDCFVTTTDTTTRQLQVVAKLSYMACQTAQDFVDLALLFGIVVTVVPGIDDATGTTAGLTDREKRFTIVVSADVVTGATFPMTFPFTFGGSEPELIQCMFNQLDPGNCQILYNFF